MNLNAIQIVTRAGAVIVATLATFIIAPPVLSPEVADINWKNIFIFIAGVVSILIFDKLRKNQNLKKIVLWLTGAFIISLGGYEYLYRRFSCGCFNLRVIISETALRPDVLSNAKTWDGPDKIRKLLEAYSCNAGSLWSDSSILPQYYALITTYLTAVILLAVLMVALGEIVKPNPNEP